MLNMYNQQTNYNHNSFGIIMNSIQIKIYLYCHNYPKLNYLNIKGGLRWFESISIHVIITIGLISLAGLLILNNHKIILLIDS